MHGDHGNRADSHTGAPGPADRYTALRHHFTVDNLRACCAALDGSKAPGVDGVTKAMYGQHLEANLQALHAKLHRMSYRPQPVRRVEIPKDDGSMRPLGISCTEDKIVQELTRPDIEQVLREKKPFILRGMLAGIKKLQGRMVQWNRCALSVSITWA